MPSSSSHHLVQEHHINKNQYSNSTTPSMGPKEKMQNHGGENIDTYNLVNQKNLSN